MHFFLATEFDYLRPKNEALSDNQKLIQERAANAFEEVAQIADSDCNGGIAYSHINEEFEPVEKSNVTADNQSLA